MYPTVFHVTHWKAGSQWLRKVFEEAAPERIVPPQPGQAHFYKDPLVPGGIYTPVYCAEGRHRAVVPPALNHRTFVVVRDPRDTLISYYYSLLYSHGDDWGNIRETRALLQKLDPIDGMAMLLHREIWDVIYVQMTWLAAGAGNLFYYEDLIRDEFRSFRAIFDLCQMDLSDARLREILANHTFERVAGRKPGSADPHSYLRNGQAGSWRKELPDRLAHLFRALYGDAMDRLGYSQRDPW